jgi:hypothetical protein
MKYSFSAIASRAAVSALLCTVVTIGSAIPAAAQSANAHAVVSACPPQSVFAITEHMLEELFFGASEPCGLAASSHQATITGPVHPITEILYELI